MSMILDFEPNYWYKGAAIRRYHDKPNNGWMVYFEDGMRTYSVIEVYASSLKQAKEIINRLNARA